MENFQLLTTSGNSFTEIQFTYHIILSLSLFSFFVILGLELKVYTLSHPPALFCDVVFFFFFFFRGGGLKLFVQAGFEPWSSWSLPPE
jgi:Na+/H+ antiporter NhaC